MTSFFMEDVRFWLRQQQGWNDLRSAQRNGWIDSFRRWRTWNRILRSAPTPFPGIQGSGSLEIHTMCYGSDWVLLIWMLKSLRMWHNEMPPIVVHVQRYIKPSAVALIRYHLPGVRLILPDESEAVVSRYLIERKLARTLYWWHRSGVMNKLIAVQVFCSSQNLLWLDSDILFYRQPLECFSEAQASSGKFVFQRDCSSNYTIPVEDSLSIVGVKLLPCVNTGIVLRAKASLDLGDVDKYLQYPEIAWPSGHIEQTLQALCVSACGDYVYLPETYAIDMNCPIDPERLVCRHYAGPSKKWISSEGMRWLINRGILDV